MSAGFKAAGEVSWGTNGAVEAYVEALAGQAAARFGADDPLAAFFRDERDAIHTGKIVFLDKFLAAPEARSRLVELFDAATEQLLREGAFTDYGRQWVESTMRPLRARLAGAPGPPA